VLQTAGQQVEKMVLGRRNGGGRGAGRLPSPPRGAEGGGGGGGGPPSMSQEDIDRAVKYVEASTRKKVKPKKI
jgi:hypothetical protein